MASTIANGLSKAINMDAAATDNPKLADLAKDTVDSADANARLTTDWGNKVSNTDHWLAISNDDRYGPSLLEDGHGREKVSQSPLLEFWRMLTNHVQIHRFDHERIPERVVHARGAGAFGTFKLIESASDVTKAGVLTDTSRTTPVFLRFSTVLGSRGSADTVRDVRGFAVKFYTDEGNWDVVGNDIPVFFVQDSMKFPDVSKQPPRWSIHTTCILLTERQYTPGSRNPIRRFHKHRAPTTTFGIFNIFILRPRTCSCGPCPTAVSLARTVCCKGLASTHIP